MDNSILPHDSDRESWEMQMSAFRGMTGSQRPALTLRLSVMTRETIRAGIRKRHIHYNEAQVQRALFKILYGEELFQEVFPSVEDRS